MAIFAKSQTHTKSLSIYGAITLFAGGLLLATLMDGAFLLVSLIYAVTACLFFSREAFHDLRQLVVLVPVTLVVSTLLWQAEYIDTSPMSVVSSSPHLTGFVVGVEMSVKAVVIVLAASAFVRTMKFSELSHLIESVSGSKSFSFVFGLAFNIRPYLERICRDTLNAIMMRGGFRPSNMISSFKYLLSSTTLNSLAKCQDLSYAAEARAFGSARNTTEPTRRDQIRPTRTDLAIIITTAVVVVLPSLSKG